MDAVYLLLLGALGLLGGLLSGLVGVGGGIIFVPDLVYAAGWNIQEAVAASLVLIVFSSLSGTVRNISSENPVDWQVVGILSGAAIPAALVGVFLSYVFGKTLVEVAFATLLLALAYPTARGRSEQEEDEGDAERKMPLPLVLLAGAGIGILAGLLGVGGGALLIPLMVLGFGSSTKTASSNSLATIFFIGLIGSAAYLVTGYSYLLKSLPPLIVGALVGAWVGVRIRDSIPEKAVRWGFSALMVVVAFRILAGTVSLF
jgi:uncharacterized membrane protein YfcA